MNQSKFNYKIVVFPVFLMVVVFFLWASLMEIGEFVRGTGRIIPAGEVQKVQHLEGGIISEILVKTGQEVTKGQVLYRIRNELAQSDLSSLQIQLYAKMAEEARLRAELAGSDNIQFPEEVFEKVPNIIDNQKRLFFQRRTNYKNSLNVVIQQAEQKKFTLIESENRVKNLAVQYNYSKQQERILERLVRSGAGSQRELIAAKLNTQQLLTDLERSENEIDTNKKALDESNARIDEAKTSYIVDVQTNLSQVLVDIEKLKESISASVDKVLRTEITSPVDGLVKTMAVNTVGGVVSPGMVVAEIIPTEDKLVIEGKILPQDRARVWPGQKATVKITAYDSSIHGQINAVVTEVSADTFLDQGTNVAYYRIKLEADNNSDNFGDSKPLFPGMVAQINIITGRRTILTYFLKPILKIFTNSLVEP